MVESQQHAHAQVSNLAGTATALLSLSSAATIVVVAQVDRVHGAILGMALAGVVALLSGAGAMWVAWRRRRLGSRAETPRILLGAVVTVWGTGQFLLGLQVTPTGQRVFGAGDVVSSLCLPILVVAVASMPRRSRVSWPATRLVLDALIVAVAGTLTLWWLLLQPALPDPAVPGSAGAVAAMMVFFDLFGPAMTGLVLARDRRAGAAVVTVGLVLQAIADITSLPAVVGDRPLPWVSGAVWCLALPLLGLGIVRFGTAPVSDGAETITEDLGESRATMISTLLSLVVLAAGVSAPIHHRWDPISVTFAMVAIALLLAREATNTVVRNRMVGWLNTEALRDVLTGLPNRSALTARLRRLDLDRQWVLLTVDLDGFKKVNDLLGPEAGDELITLVGTVLRRTVPATCLVARMGGDEFAVLAEGGIGFGERLAEQLGAAVRMAARERGGVEFSVSIGVGRVAPAEGAGRSEPARTTGRSEPVEETGPVDPDHTRLNALLESAAALRAAKAAGRNQIALYPGAVEQARQRRLLLELRLRAAIESRSLEMYAQPLVDLGTGRTVGFESLARWTDGMLGPVSPGEFIPVAEQTGMITSLGEFALRETLSQAKVGGVVGRDVELSVNVSPIQLRDPSFAPMAIDLVAELGLDPGQLLLEVTEAILVAEDDPASGALARLAAAGIQLAIDDFGTGYSALSYLRWLPLSMIKIDRSWVVSSVNDRRTRDIVGVVVSLAHTLGATVVMEGIEDEATAQLCRDLGADLGQGWLFGRPAPWPTAAAELAKQPPAPAPVRARAGGSASR